MIKYIECFDSNKRMSFKLLDNKLLKVPPNMEKN